MVRVEKIEVTDEKATYKYFPEARLISGLFLSFGKLGSANLERSSGIR